MIWAARYSVLVLLFLVIYVTYWATSQWSAKKISDLTAANTLKDERISNLTQKVEALSSKQISPLNTSEPPSPFTGFTAVKVGEKGNIGTVEMQHNTFHGVKELIENDGKVGDVKMKDNKVTP